MIYIFEARQQWWISQFAVYFLRPEAHAVSVSRAINNVSVPKSQPSGQPLTAFSPIENEITLFPIHTHDDRCPRAGWIIISTIYNQWPIKMTRPAGTTA